MNIFTAVFLMIVLIIIGIIGTFYLNKETNNKINKEYELEEEMKKELYYKILSELIDSGIGFTLKPEDEGYKAIKTMLEENKDLKNSINELYEDYQDLGLEALKQAEKLDRIDAFLNGKIVSEKTNDKIANIAIKEIVRQLNIYRRKALEIMEEEDKED